MSAGEGALPLRAALRVEAGYATLFAGLFLSLGAQIAFFPLWLEGRGMTPAEIGAINAFAIAVRILAGLMIPALADWTGAPRRMMAMIALAGALFGGLFLVADSRVELYLLFGALSAVYAGLMPIADATAYSEATRQGFSYRRPRSVGSFAFIAATVGLGLVVERFGRDAITLWIGLALALAAVGSLMARVGPLPAAPADRPTAAARFGDWLRLIGDGRFLLFLAAIAALQSSHAVYYAYGSVHWSALGWSDAVIGRLWAFGVVVEIVLFLFGGKALARIDPAMALALAGLGGLLRWAAMAVDPGLPATVALQVLHAATFGVTHLAALAFIAQAAPPALAASAQGLVSALGGGVGMLLATIGATALYPLYGAGAYGLAAALSAAGALLALRLGRIGAVAPSP